MIILGYLPLPHIHLYLFILSSLVSLLGQFPLHTPQFPLTVGCSPSKEPSGPFLSLRGDQTAPVPWILLG